MSLSIIFMGTPDFSVPVLRAIQEAGHRIAAVYCQPPRPAGRGMGKRLSPVHAFAMEQNLLVRYPASLRDEQNWRDFAALSADIAVVVAYGLILPRQILEIPALGCINAHASLLPRWRGAAPIQRAIAAGDSITGVTIMQMDEGLDTGPALLCRPLSIADGVNAGQLHDQLAKLAGTLTVDALEAVEKGVIRPVAQSLEGVTYARKIAKDEGHIDWSLPAEVLERHIRALTPWPGAWFDYLGERLKPLAVSLLPDVCGEAGLVIDENMTIACGRGALQITKIQRSGKSAMPIAAFLRGFPISAGTKF